MRAILPSLTALSLAGCFGADLELPEGTYRLTQIGDGPVPSATITFDGDGAISGEAPCNLYNAQIQSAWPEFELGAIAVTRRACPDMEGETRYLTALESVTKGAVDGDTLTLTGGGESLQFTQSE